MIISILQMQSRRAYFVFALFGIYLVLKLPYVVMDMSTSNDVATTNWPHFQTVLVWIMFGFSAVYPIITFAWFSDMKERLVWCFAGKKKKQISTGGIKSQGELIQILQ